MGSPSARLMGAPQISTNPICSRRPLCAHKAVVLAGCREDVKGNHHEICREAAVVVRLRDGERRRCSCAVAGCIAVAGGEKNRYLPGKQYRILRKGKAVVRA